MKKFLLRLFIIITAADLGLCAAANAEAGPTYRTQEECQQKTGKSCSFRMCDVAAQGKTIEETCGKGFKKGWGPVSSSQATSPRPITATQNSTTNEWQTFQDSRYIFQFEYPAKWSTEDQQGAVGTLILKNEQKNEIITISGINFAVIGISYCGAYPQDSRCEVLKAESGDVFIDWNVDGEAYAMLSAPNGTFGVGVTLHKVNPETKTAFLRILSTFKFLK